MEEIKKATENTESTEEQKNIPYTRTQPRVQRNEPCPCGSGRKFKVCCWDKASARAYR